ncbi:MAG TPA: energy transducer TonB [Candidatus Methylomirabilis sp.]|nr:energy transducer TonB [Candidatus Methylomirabilis sp.]
MPTPRPAPPPPEATRGTFVESPPAATPPPERSGLILGGPSPFAPARPPTPSGSAARRPSLPSLRDQLASIGKDVLRDSGEAQRTINLDDRRPDFLPYLERLKWRIQSVWTVPEEARQSGLGGESELVFTLNKTGTLTSLRLVHSSGFPLLDQQALLAVRTAAPFEAFPPEFGDEPWNIRATFYVTSLRYRRN